MEDGCGDAWSWVDVELELERAAASGADLALTATVAAFGLPLDESRCTASLDGRCDTGEVPGPYDGSWHQFVLSGDGSGARVRLVVGIEDDPPCRASWEGTAR